MAFDIPTSDWGPQLNGIYAGSIVFNAGFGLYVFLALSSIYFLWRQPVHNAGRRILLAYTVVMLGLNSSFLVVMATWTRALLSFESYRSSSDATVLPGLLMGAPPILLNDVLFMYRAFCILSKSRRLLVLPCMLYVAMIGLSILGHIRGEFHQSGAPAMPFFLGFITVSIALNTLLTLLTAWRLWSQQRIVRGVGRAVSFASWHSTVIILITESAAAWVLAAVLYLVVLVTNMRGVYFFEYLFQITAQLSPTVLIYRVALNKHSVTSEDSTVQVASRTRISIPMNTREHGDSCSEDRKGYTLEEEMTGRQTGQHGHHGISVHDRA